MPFYLIFYVYIGNVILCVRYYVYLIYLYLLLLRKDSFVCNRNKNCKFIKKRDVNYGWWFYIKNNKK